EDLYSVPMTGQPTDYCYYEGTIRVWPTPNIAYPMVWLTVTDVTPALDYNDDSSTNAWTVQGYDLIDARARYLLYRDYLPDTDGANLAQVAGTQALSSLRGQDNRLMGTGRIRPSW